MNIDEMQAWRELDATIAEKVMGWTIKQGGPGGWEWVITPPHNESEQFSTFCVGYKTGFPYYSTDIAAAWQVVDKLRSQGKTLEIWVELKTVTVSNRTGDGIPLDGWDWEDEIIMEKADTAPLAICRAALKMVK